VVYGCQLFSISPALVHVEKTTCENTKEHYYKEFIMTVDQHLKVANWHIEQARLHATQDGYKCGCPLNDHDQKAIEAVEAGKIEEEKE